MWGQEEGVRLEEEARQISHCQLIGIRISNYPQHLLGPIAILPRTPILTPVIPSPWPGGRVLMAIPILQMRPNDS